MGDWLCTFGTRNSDAFGDCYITTSQESLVVYVLISFAQPLIAISFLIRSLSAVLSFLQEHSSVPSSRPQSPMVSDANGVLSVLALSSVSVLLSKLPQLPCLCSSWDVLWRTSIAPSSTGVQYS